MRRLVSEPNVDEESDAWLVAREGVTNRDSAMEQLAVESQVLAATREAEHRRRDRPVDVGDSVASGRLDADHDRGRPTVAQVGHRRKMRRQRLALLVLHVFVHVKMEVDGSIIVSITIAGQSNLHPELGTRGFTVDLQVMRMPLEHGCNQRFDQAAWLCIGCQPN